MIPDRSLNFLSFSPCPIGDHKGELWKKLDPLDFDVDRFILQDISFSWSDYVPIEWLQADTFPEWTMEDWRALMKMFYKIENVFGMQLTFESLHDAIELTTFRAYKPQTHAWYLSKMAKEIELWAIRIKEPKAPKEQLPEPEKIKSLEDFL